MATVDVAEVARAYSPHTSPASKNTTVTRRDGEGELTTAPSTQRARLLWRQRTAAVLLLTALTVVVSGCADDNTVDADPKPTPSSSKDPEATPTKSQDPQAAEKKKILNVYARMWDEQVKAYAIGTEKGTDLEKYATKEALGRALGDLLTMKQGGTISKGAPTHNAEVLSVDMKAEIPKAKLSDCLDISDWKTVDRKTRKVKPFPDTQPPRYFVAVEAEFWDEQQQWMITNVTPNGEQEC